MFKKMLICLVTLIMVVSLFGCNSKEEETTPVDDADTSATKENDSITIAVVPKALDNAVFLDSKTGAEEAGKELGIEVLWEGSTKSDAAEQVGVIEGLIQKKVDGILISCNNPTALDDVIQKATDAGIKVATFDSDAPDSARIFYAGTNNYEVGKKCGEKMKALLKGQADKVKVGVLTGNAGVFNLEERIRGFKDGVKGANVEILEPQLCNDDVATAVQVLESYTQANPDLGGWFVVGAWPFLSSVDTLPSLENFKGKIVSVDSFYPMLEFVQKDYVDALVGQDFVAMGKLGVENLYKAIQGETSEEVIDTGSIDVDKSNVEEILANTKPW